MTQPKIHVVLAADANYLPGLKVTRESMVRSCSDPDRLEFHIFDEKALVGLEGIDAFEIYNTSRMPYLRLFLPDLMPDVDWVVYSDVDTVWHRDVCELAGLFDPSVSIQWVRDIRSAYLETREWLGRAKSSGLIHSFDRRRYGCSGVCLMNLKKMRECRTAQRSLELIRVAGNPVHADQDLLNALYNHDCGLLPREWDVILCYPDPQAAIVMHITGAGLRFHDPVPPVYPPQYQFWWNCFLGTREVHPRSRLLSLFWPFRFLTWLLPLQLRQRIQRQLFYSRLLVSQSK